MPYGNRSYYILLPRQSRSKSPLRVIGVQLTYGMGYAGDGEYLGAAYRSLVTIGRFYPKHDYRTEPLILLLNTYVSQVERGVLNRDGKGQYCTQCKYSISTIVISYMHCLEILSTTTNQPTLTSFTHHLAINRPSRNFCIQEKNYLNPSKSHSDLNTGHRS